MSYKSWASNIVKRMKPCDISFVKLAMIAFGLMLAKIIPEILGLAWYWYLIFFIILAIKPMLLVFKK